VQVTQLAAYAVKSLGGLSLDQALITPQGLADDRRWAVVDPHGRTVTARECHALLGITAQAHAHGVRLRTRAGEERDVPTPPADAPTVEVALSRVARLTLGESAASDWLSSRVGREVRLVHLSDPEAREIGAGHGGRPGETMNLADAGPVLLVSEASVSRLRDWVLEESGEEWVDQDEAVARFRGNVVIDGDVPFAEDGWRRVRIGDVTYRRGELCDRCVMTTIALGTLETTHEPIRTLARHRKWDGQTWFGVRLVPELEPGATGHVRIGDEVAPEGG
jgi:uncharacterized protein YcbX